MAWGDYETMRPLPPERREWEKGDMGASERPTGIYNAEKAQYEFSDGVVVTDRELMAGTDPLIRLYYIKVAERRRAVDDRVDALILGAEAIKAQRSDPAAFTKASFPAEKFPPEYRADLERSYKAEVERTARLQAVRSASVALWTLARLGYVVARARGWEGLHHLGAVGAVMARAADFNYGGATRGWLLEMD